MNWTSGNRALALRVYERCRCLLSEAFGVSLSPEVYGRILKM